MTEASTQSDRAILDIVGTKDTKEISDSIQGFFENNDNVSEIALFKNKRIISVKKQDALSNKFEVKFRKIWVGKSKKIRGSIK